MTFPRGAALALGLGIVLFFDVLRVFLPSLITLFGRAGETPAEQMGLFAALWFVLPFVALLMNPRWSLYGGAAGLVVCRLLLQGEVSQLYVSSLGVTFGLFFLYGCAHTLPRAAVPVGIGGGLGASVVVHLLLDGVDLVWRDGTLPWLATITLCAAFLATLRQAPSDDLAPSSTWFLLAPTLLLVGMLVLTPGLPDEPASPWLSAGRTALVALVALTPVIMTTLPDDGRRSPWFLVAGFALIATDAVVERRLAPTMVGMLLLGYALCVTASHGKSGKRPGLVILSGMSLFLVATFLYYAAYDLDLGFPNVAVPIALLFLVAFIEIVTRETAAKRPGLGRRVWLIVLGLALVVGATGWRTVPEVRPKQGDTFTLIAYNIRMGFGLDGRLSLDDIAAWAATRKPDVVLLSEVDRGWLLNGGHDDLARIARGLGMRYYFAPAADPLWGDALLTNLPVKDVASHRLGKYGYPTGAQAQTAVIQVGGREVGIVNTHLQAPPGQAPEVAALVNELSRTRPVVVAGDLNTTHADPQMKALEAAGLTDPLIALGDPRTSPADAPTKRIDHVLLTNGLTVVNAEVPSVPYSDHLPVVTTLRITTVDQGG
ncbi:endonuclease/exonuclease/phosphatase family protein [Nonomuraea sp. NPDC050556]|uniref:endonuclease/exonuclease/phosphatase family protein n=1 Tax=Nonomuraea sp. NPDC050556 TaxID=3364369 RepID=UPI00378FF9C6